MQKEKKPVLFILLFAGFILFIFLLMQPAEVHLGWGDIALLFPSGKIGIKERNLLLIIQVLMLLVVIPVYILTFAFSWKYRADNAKAKYTPDWDDNRIAEYIWWGLPCLLIIVIGGLTLHRTYQLDPYRSLPSERKGITIQVVALQWKWLFIYPEERIATVNFVQFPENTPIHFEITSDAPMNSFWIPDLGSQIYAMPKMRTNLNLIAEKLGEFRGSSANISGVGFAGMHFIAKSSTEEQYHQWVEQARQSQQSLGLEEYNQLARPSENNPVAIYELKDKQLFDQVIMKYTHPQKKE